MKNKISNHFRDITSIGSPILLILITIIQFDFSLPLIKTLLYLLIIEVLCNIIKLLYFKPRPIKEVYKNIFEKIDASSFPSIHTARIAFTFLVLTINTDNILKKIILISVIIYVGYSRIYLKKHFIIDVLFGFLIGFIFFILYNI